MLTSEEIKNIASSGEGYNAEFKERVPAKVQDLAREICAFANAAGGVLLMGINDEGKIIGIDLTNPRRSAIQDSLQQINPAIDVFFYEVEVDSKKVGVIEVSSGSRKPYALSGAIYTRQGPNTQKITAVEQMRDFFQQADRIYFDEGPCAGFEVEEDLDQTFFERFRAMANLSPSVSRDQILTNLKIILPEGNFKNGGVLFFGKEPERFYEKAVVRCIAFEGNTKTQIIDDKIFGGPLMNQYESSIAWLKSNLRVRYEITDAGPRRELWEIPEVVFKEAIINALSHRDYYDRGARITIELFQNRVEISNPGGLVSAISKDDFGTRSHSRNPLIFGLFERIHMVEQVGSGISRIRDALKQRDLSEPEFRIDGMFTLVVKRPEMQQQTGEKTKEETVEKTKEKTREKIIRLISENKEITTAELADATNLSTSGVEYHLNKLKKAGVLKRIGPDKGGYWQIQNKK